MIGLYGGNGVGNSGGKGWMVKLGNEVVVTNGYGCCVLDDDGNLKMSTGRISLKTFMFSYL